MHIASDTTMLLIVMLQRVLAVFPGVIAHDGVEADVEGCQDVRVHPMCVCVPGRCYGGGGGGGGGGWWWWW